MPAGSIGFLDQVTGNTVGLGDLLKLRRVDSTSLFNQRAT